MVELSFWGKRPSFRGDFLLVLGSVFPFQVETSPHTFWCIYINIHIIPRPSKKKAHPKKCRTHHGLLGLVVVDLLASHARYQGSMDLLLGPSSWDFRMAAAQVAEEFSMPLLLWSFPESYGIGWVMPSNTMAPRIWKVAQIHGDFAGKAEFISPGLGFSWGVAGWVFVYCISMWFPIYFYMQNGPLGCD